jgi:transposase
MDSMTNVVQFPPLPVSILGLSDVEIVTVEIDSQNQYIFKVKSTKSQTLCRFCGKPTEPYGNGRTLLLRHLPILGRKTFIEISPPRGRCLHCNDNPTTTQPSDWYDRKSPHTKAYEKHILLSLINSTIVDVSKKEDLGYKAIEAIVDRYIQTEVDWSLIKKIGLLGIDEITSKKGYRNYLTLLTSRIDNQITILGVLKGREKETVKAFLSSIPTKLHKTIIAVCTDMYDGFINAAKEVFGKKVHLIVDRFHVAKLYRKCLISLRKKELARLKKLLPENEYQSLKRAIALLCHRKEFMTDEEKKIVEPLFNLSPSLKSAYQFCCELTGIYNSHIDKESANKKITSWIDDVEKSNLVCFRRFIKTLKKYRTEIENYFINRDTSGFVEGINNKAKVMKRRCYGIFNLKHFFQRLFLDFSGYDIFRNHQQAHAL